MPCGESQRVLFVYAKWQSNLQTLYADWAEAGMARRVDFWIETWAKKSEFVLAPMANTVLPNRLSCPRKMILSRT